MGSTISAMTTRIFVQKPIRILMVGYNTCGKTTILYKLKYGEILTTMPTIGFNVETVEYKNVSFAIWDVGGHEKMRKLWRQYFTEFDALIFVVDANDRDNIWAAECELHFMMEKDFLLLIFSNKHDLPNAMSSDELTDQLKLNELKNRKWHIQETSAIQGTGLYEGFDWLLNELAK